MPELSSDDTLPCTTPNPPNVRMTMYRKMHAVSIATSAMINSV